MAYTNSVAIIGATTTVGALVAESIAANFRLLLMDKEESRLDLLQNKIQALHKDAEIDIVNCCKNASWEADIIVLASDEGLEDIAASIKEVSNCKTVLHFTSQENNLNNLQQLLPHTNVVSIILSQPFTAANANAFIHGTDKEALDTGKMIVAAMGCAPISGES